MRKKRLIYTLLYNNGNFMLSRNFRLQKVGNLEWLEKHYNFKKIAFSIDELIILNVNRVERNIDVYCKDIKKIIENVFVPVSVGGGVNNVEYAERLFRSGADKIVINSALIEQPDLVASLIKQYGSQAIIASVDFVVDNGIFNVFINNGETKISYNLFEYINYIQRIGVGEVYLNSIQMDGTGQGYMIKEVENYLTEFKIPVILAGGAGNSNHLIEAVKHPSIDAVATANLFNFIGDALPNSRNEMMKENISLAKFQEMDTEKLKLINNAN